MEFWENRGNSLKRTNNRHDALRRTENEIKHSHICDKMPPSWLEPATSTYSARTITQLTKWEDDTENEITHSHISAKNATCGARTRNIDICGPDHYANYKTGRRCREMKLHIRTLVLKCRLWGSNPQHRHMRPRPLRILQNLQTRPKRRTVTPHVQKDERLTRTNKSQNFGVFGIPNSSKNSKIPKKLKK